MNSDSRANYTNLTKGIHETTEYLELFLNNLLCEEHNELHNRTMHISGIYQDYHEVDIGSKKVDIENEKADIGSKKVDIENEKVDIGNIEENVNVSQIYENIAELCLPKTLKHIQNIYDAFHKQKIFGRWDVQKVTGLGSSRASVLLKMLVEEDIIVRVSGHGKGKYKFR